LESRTATLIRRGYSTGRLDFEYPYSYSRLREAQILDDIEKETYLEVMALRAIIDATMMSVVRTREAFDIPYKTLESYSQIALPYLHKKDKVVTESIDKATEEIMAKFKAEKKKQATGAKKKK
jgi:hypothetical protein